MDEDDYAKLLLESSFKEANFFWIRNAGYSAAQALLLGLVVGKHLSLGMSVGISLAGFSLAVLHGCVLRVSKHYNETWLGALRSWVNGQAKEYPKDASWSEMRCTLGKLDSRKKFPWLRATELTYGVPILFGVAWVGFFIKTCSEMCP